MQCSQGFEEYEKYGLSRESHVPPPLQEWVFSSSYEELLQKLFSFLGRRATTFSSMQKLDDLMGNPHRGFRSIHVGGTNGKGSVATKIAEALRIEGYRVGLYTSPHIASVRERIRVNGEMISIEAICEYLPRIFKAVETLAPAPFSFFDLLTALAFRFFLLQSVDWAVIEVGLGGRLDATNVLDAELSIITSIGHDHMNILGSSLRAIAKEKAGILRNGVPLIVGPTAAPFFPSGLAVQPTLSPFYDEENREIAKAALLQLGISHHSIAKGLEVRPICRFEKIGRTILDVAHNQEGFFKLIEALQADFPREKFHFILGFSKDKDWQTCLQLIQPLAEKISWVDSHSRLLPMGGQSVKDVLGTSLSRDVVCGSFYLMAEARRCLGIFDPLDPEQRRGMSTSVDPSVMAHSP